MLTASNVALPWILTTMAAGRDWSRRTMLRKSMRQLWEAAGQHHGRGGGVGGRRGGVVGDRHWGYCDDSAVCVSLF